MNRILLTLAVAALPLAACQKTPDVSYQDRAVQTAAKTGARREAPAATAPSRKADAAERFKKDFGDDQRFVYESGFRLDRWTGCVVDGRTGVAVLDDEGRPECGYVDTKHGPN